MCWNFQKNIVFFEIFEFFFIFSEKSISIFFFFVFESEKVVETLNFYRILILATINHSYRLSFAQNRFWNDSYQN